MKTHTILEAARRGDLEAVRYFVEEKGVDVDCTEDEEEPLLFSVIDHAHCNPSTYLTVIQEGKRKFHITNVESLHS